MKKFIFPALISVALFSTACGAKKPAATSGFDYKVGTASYTHTNDSYGYTEGKNGRGAVSTTLVAAVFDNDGKIVRISIDEVESRIGIDSAGQLADFTAGEVKSKKELGDAYGMKAYSSIGKEWYQQVETLEKWLEGKAVTNIIGDNAARMFTAENSYSTGNMANSLQNKTAGSAATYGTDSMGSNSMGSGSMAGSGSVLGDVMSGVNSAMDDMTDGTDYNNMNTAQGSWMDADLKAGVTISTANIEKAIEKAWRNAK